MNRTNPTEERDNGPRWRWPNLIWPADLAVVCQPGEAVRLRGARCTACCRVSFPCRDRCTWCGDGATECPIPAEGWVVGRTEVLLDTPGSAIPAPYCVGLVRFEEAGLDILGLAEPGRALSVDQPVGVVATQPFATSDLHFAFRPIAAGHP